MNISKLKNKIIACFQKEELQNIFETAKKIELLDEINKQDIQNNCENIVSIISNKILNNTSVLEVFASIFVFADFYKSRSEICFELKDSFNPNRDRIATLQDLNNFRNDPPDFIIKSSDGYREFELKRYRDNLATNNVFNFIEKKIKHYGNNLGDMNLLLVLQSAGSNISKIDFHELHSRVKNLNLKFLGQVLISYNENNKNIVINQVFPELTTTRISV